MICRPCREGVHTGPSLDLTPTCPGGTWCACQHRKTRTTEEEK